MGHALLAVLTETLTGSTLEVDLGFRGRTVKGYSILELQNVINQRAEGLLSPSAL